ncbi:MAG: hypothetical protein AB7V32_08030 [Candidatus Berkiella sp.]
MKSITCQNSLAMICAGAGDSYFPIDLHFGTALMTTWGTVMGYMLGSFHPVIHPITTIAGTIFGYTVGTDLYKNPSDRYFNFDFLPPVSSSTTKQS